ncbi:MAG: hypothetical protein SFV32_07790 [Opitutaceae bacterium]|nr:hypothetical protein [Opitutaceae bacterium]
MLKPKEAELRRKFLAGQKCDTGIPALTRQRPCEGLYVLGAVHPYLTIADEEAAFGLKMLVAVGQFRG